MMSDLMTANLIADLFYLTGTLLLCCQNLILFVNLVAALDGCIEPLEYITRAFTLYLATEKFFIHNLQ